MRVRNLLAAAAVLSIAATALTGCSQATCNGPGAEPPHVALDTSAWFDAYPQSTLEACFDGACAEIQPTDSNLPVHLDAHQHASDPGQPMDLTVTAVDGGRQVATDSITVNLTGTSVSGPCGSRTEWAVDATISAAGRLSSSGE
jgi:hypothetical protein